MALNFCSSNVSSRVECTLQIYVLQGLQQCCLLEFTIAVDAVPFVAFRAYAVKTSLCVAAGGQWVEATGVASRETFIHICQTGNVRGEEQCIFIY